MKALVADAELRNAVAGLRGLGRAGVDVLAAGTTARASGQRSRYAGGRAITASAVTDPVRFAADVARLGEEHGPLIAYPGREESLDALFAAKLPTSVKLPYPEGLLVDGVRDKRALADLAGSVGLGAPETLAASTAREFLRCPPDGPFVVKKSPSEGTAKVVAVVNDPQDLESVGLRLQPSDRVLVQRIVRGPLIAVCLVLDRAGAVVARFQQEASRTWPPTAGASSLARSVPLDPELVERCAALLSAAGYWGLAHMQLIGGAAGPALIDVNTRFYGSLPLALACGVNLPAAWHAVAKGDCPTPAPTRYRTGVTYRWLEADVVAALRGQRRRLRPVAPPRAGAMWAADDPVASLVLGGAAAATWTRGGLRRLTRLRPA